MNIGKLGIITLAVVLTGCTTSNLPRGARLVGGGLSVEYTAPSDGTAILIERTSGRIVASESLVEGDTFTFKPNWNSYEEVLFRMFGDTNVAQEGGWVVIPTNTVLQLYFVPEKAKKQ